PYCGRCGTGLSSHELGQPGVYQDVLDPSVIVRFKRSVEPVDGRGHEAESFLAWTTTPWTLPCNFALAVHPDIEYVKARIVVHYTGQSTAQSHATELVWVASQRADAVLPKGFEIVERCTGRELVSQLRRPVARPAFQLPDFDYLPLFDPTK